mmetsp:Transcript_110824/g.203200  ORF Transcript_110824/g.203200 Transcript_110824/m.203200 type:complete len:243 (+) Transcript_110824:35-763(+)
MVYANLLGPLVGFLKGGSALKAVSVSAAFFGTGAAHDFQDTHDAFDDGDFIGHGDPNSLEDHGSHGGHGDHGDHGDHEDHAEHEDHEHGDHEEHEHGEEHEENAEDHTEDPEEHGAEGEEHENLEDEAAHEAGAEEMEVAHAGRSDAHAGRGDLETQKTENEGLGAAFSRIMKGVAATSVMVSAASRLVEARSREFGLAPWGAMAAACISPPPKMKRPRVRARSNREEVAGLTKDERASRAL